ncbi:TPA: hypothetical protein DIV48_01795 [Candidatus Kaiserbacteria bacterium]|nr:MAG: hypothetical protein UY93_C0002G0108 [Parcubacteria group bacterium GW2011_GWA1_56_13]KKW45589.1 MAG: hypothetical protein UY97_C0018G0004 [Parcubacteria group bacterium GW2011_GWB1_57_6]HCR52364.1 hypothetical protein [Candidatus Kaiserbacteria bacterium]
MTHEWFFRLRIVLLTVSGITLSSFLITALLLFAAGGRNERNVPHADTDTFIYSFNAPGILHETTSAEKSPSPYWFLESGGEMIIENGIGETLQYMLPSQDRWRIAYGRSSSIDTDNGFRPQNLFRLLTKSRWENFSQQAQFYIARDNFSASQNRGASNGILFMSRYNGNGETLYYGGIRVDGTAVIKKKYRGRYYTMAQAKLFPGVYSVSGGGSSRNLLPHDEWFGLKLTTITNVGGGVTLSLYVQRSGRVPWSEVLSATDTGKNYGGTPPIIGPNLAGIRTDFMDIKFDDYRVENISVQS